MPKYRDFNDYLYFKFERDEPIKHFQSDDEPEIFDEWLGELEPEEWINYAEEYAKTIVGNGYDNDGNPIQYGISGGNKEVKE